jgi:hypothetical protein
MQITINTAMIADASGRLRFSRHVGRASQVEVGDPADHLGVQAVVHDDPVFKGSCSMAAFLTGRWSGGKGRSRPVFPLSKEYRPCAIVLYDGPI